MTDHDRNVIQFPGGKDPRQLAQEFADQLLQPGHDPRALVAQLLDIGARRVAGRLPERRQPSLPPPKETLHRYRVRVDLDHAKPPIWRRPELSSDLPLAELHAGAIMLLAVGAGDTPYEGIKRYGSDLLWHAGWAADHAPPSEHAAIEFARPTWDALKVAGCSPRALTREPVGEPARQLSRAALRRR